MPAGAHELNSNWNNCLSNAIRCMGQNIKSLAACVCLGWCVRTGIGGRISRKRLKIEIRFQWDTNRKWHLADWLVTWPMTSHDLERSRSWPQYVWGALSRKWLKIKARLQYSIYRKWHMADRLVTWPMSSCDLDRLRSWHQYVGAHYLKYDWRYTLSYDFMWP